MMSFDTQLIETNTIWGLLAPQFLLFVVLTAHLFVPRVFLLLCTFLHDHPDSFTDLPPGIC